MQIDLRKVQTTANLVEALDRGTRILLAEMEQLTAESAQNNPIDFSTLPDLTQRGNYGISESNTWLLTDSSRDRTFNVLVYQPQRWRQEKTPVVLISHGLGSQPEDFDHWAQQLASYGYMAVLVQHIGSDIQQKQALLTGFSRELFRLDEFINRPQDVSYVIDELERRNKSEFEGRLDLEKVGVIGHSFGGYNMLVLGGATLDFDNLERYCNSNQWSPNISLLLQCSALQLSREERNLTFKDSRVKAIVTANPVSGSIFGAEGMRNLEIPVAFIGGSSDPATPAVIEQLRPFVWARSQNKYFAIVRGQAHVNFTRLDGQIQAMLDTFEDLTLPEQDIIDKYANIYLVAFFERHLLNDESFAPYLTGAYSQYISRSPHEIYLVDQSADLPLSKLFNRHKPRSLSPIYPPFFSK